MRDFGSDILRREEGFTLPEMLVTMMIMIIVLFSLYSIFDMSIRVFSFGNDKVEAVENARQGLEKMEREIRAAYPCNASDSGTTNDYLFLNATDTTCSTTTAPSPPTQTQITFANDRSSTTDPGYRKVDFPGEVISYYQTGNELTRSQGGAARTVVSPVATNGLQFAYINSSGNLFTPTDQSQIYAVRISLTINVDGRTQTLTTDVDLRSRG